MRSCPGRSLAAGAAAPAALPGAGRTPGGLSPPSGPLRGWRPGSRLSSRKSYKSSINQVESTPDTSLETL